MTENELLDKLYDSINEARTSYLEKYSEEPGEVGGSFTTTGAKRIRLTMLMGVNKAYPKKIYPSEVKELFKELVNIYQAQPLVNSGGDFIYTDDDIALGLIESSKFYTR